MHSTECPPNVSHKDGLTDEMQCKTRPSGRGCVAMWSSEKMANKESAQRDANTARWL